MIPKPPESKENQRHISIEKNLHQFPKRLRLGPARSQSPVLIHWLPNLPMLLRLTGLVQSKVYIVILKEGEPADWIWSCIYLKEAWGDCCSTFPSIRVARGLRAMRSICFWWMIQKSTGEWSMLAFRLLHQKKRTWDKKFWTNPCLLFR